MIFSNRILINLNKNKLITIRYLVIKKFISIKTFNLIWFSFPNKLFSGLELNNINKNFYMILFQWKYIPDKRLPLVRQTFHSTNNSRKYPFLLYINKILILFFLYMVSGHSIKFWYRVLLTSKRRICFECLI